MQTEIMPTVQEQSIVLLAQLRDRQRRPVKPATLKLCKSALRTWIIPMFGLQPLESIDNGAMKSLVNRMVREKKSPATIKIVTWAFKSLVASDIDDNGNKRLPREWNEDFIDAPKIVPEAQKTPIMTSEELSKAIQGAKACYQPLYSLLAGTGLRISEILSLRMGPDDGVSSIWDPVTGTVIVRKAMYNREEQSTKSAAGVRQVDVHRDLTAYLREVIKREPGEYLFQTRKGGPQHYMTLFRNAKKDGVPGFHSLRRFRATRTDSIGVAESLLGFWLGHTKGSVTQKYIKPGKGIELRRGWCERVGLGFELPKEKTDDVEDSVHIIESQPVGPDALQAQDE